HQRLDQAGVLHHLGAAPDLEPARMRPVHQEQMHAVVLGEIADAEILPIAREIREAESAVVEYLQEARRTAAMLHVRPAFAARRRHEEAVALRNVANEFWRQRVADGGMRLQPLAARARTV